jgi:lysophospholipase L1-like esterase
MAGPVISADGSENPSDPAIHPASFRPATNPELPTLFIAGDSAAAKGKGAHQQGWAVPFTDYFDLEKINVDNHARGGRSSRTFITEGLLGHRAVAKSAL